MEEPHLQLTDEYLFHAFNTIYFCLSIAIITSKYSSGIYIPKTILRLAFKRKIGKITLISLFFGTFSCIYLDNLVVTQL